MAKQSRSVGRPTRDAPTIDRVAIGEATLEVLREHSPTALSISKIANVLGVRSQTLYYHVNSIVDAVNAARGVLLSRLDLTVLDREPWEDAVADFAIEYYRIFQPLGQANSIFFLYTITDPMTLKMYERFLVRAMEELAPVGQEIEDLAEPATHPSSQAAMQLLLHVEYNVFSLIYEHSSWSGLFDPEAIDREGAVTLKNALAQHDRRPEFLERRLRTAVTSLVHELTTATTQHIFKM